MSTQNLSKIEKQAKAFFAMGLVTKSGNGYAVSTPSLRGYSRTYQIEDGRCQCLYFEETLDCPHLRAASLMAAAFPESKSKLCLTEACNEYETPAVKDELCLDCYERRAVEWHEESETEREHEEYFYTVGEIEAHYRDVV